MKCVKCRYPEAPAAMWCVAGILLFAQGMWLHSNPQLEAAQVFVGGALIALGLALIINRRL